jgi:hypothetical protein
MPLGFANIDVLPAKEPGIDRPSTRPDHCQSGANGCQHDGNPWITGTRESYPHLSDGYHSSGYWGPQADEKKYPRAGCNDLRGYGCKLVFFM